MGGCFLFELIMRPGGFAKAVPEGRHLAKIHIRVAVVHIVPGRGIQVQPRQHLLQPSKGNPAMQIQIEEYKTHNSGKIKRGKMLGLGDAYEQQRPKGKDSFHGAHGKAGKRSGVAEGVVMLVKRK